MSFALASAIAFTSAPMVSSPVLAQGTLIELLFNKNRAERPRYKQAERPRYRKRQLPSQRVVRVPSTPRKAPAPRKIQQISGPKYYSYKAAPLSIVTMASLLPETDASGALEPNLEFEMRRFAEALRLMPETRLSIEKEIAAALKAHYAENPKFLWSRGTAATSGARALAAVLDDADAHGLDASQYGIAVPPDGFSMNAPAARAAELLEFEIELTARAVRYALDLRDGVVNPNKLSGYHDFPRKRLTPEEALRRLAKADDPVLYLKTLEPQHPAYRMLQGELAKLRSMDIEEIVIPEGTFVKPGQTEEELPTIMKALDRKAAPETRAKHAATFAEYLGGLAFDENIVALVKDFQRDNGLVPDGIIGKNTLRYLSDVSQSQKIRRVELALERLRWHPEKFGSRHVFINQPAYRATYSENFQDTLSMRTIVGKKSNQTSFFHDEIEMVVYNPYWGVPQSIIVNEMLPKLHRDPSYLDRNGYVVTSRSGKRIASANIDWWKYAGPVPYNVRQKPGPDNALGNLKILFPNKHAIYMHDTPSRNLFERDERALSHGCVRLQQPREMAAAVLGKDTAYISSRIGGSESVENLEQKIPVFVAYFTAWPTPDGTMEYFPDIYDRDMYLERALDAVNGVRDETDV